MIAVEHEFSDASYDAEIVKRRCSEVNVAGYEATIGVAIFDTPHSKLNKRFTVLSLE